MGTISQFRAPGREVSGGIPARHEDAFEIVSRKARGYLRGVFWWTMASLCHAAFLVAAIYQINTDQGMYPLTESIAIFSLFGIFACILSAIQSHDKYTTEIIDNAITYGRNWRRF